MSDFPTAKFELRQQVVAIVPEPQRDEPPGRGHVAHRTVVLAEHSRRLRPEEVARETAAIHAEGAL